MPGASQELLNPLEWQHGENSVLGKLASLYIRHFWLGGWGHRGHWTDCYWNQNLIWRSTGILWKWKRNVFAVKYTAHKFYHFNHFSVRDSVARVHSCRSAITTRGETLQQLAIGVISQRMTSMLYALSLEHFLVIYHILQSISITMIWKFKKKQTSPFLQIAWETLCWRNEKGRGSLGRKRWHVGRIILSPFCQVRSYSFSKLNSWVPPSKKPSLPCLPPKLSSLSGA